MKTKFRKIAALALSLVLICALAVSASALTIGNSQIIFTDLVLVTRLNLEAASATALFDIDGTDNLEALVTPEITYCHSIITLNYVTWPEDQQRPDAMYPQTSSKESYTLSGASHTLPAPSGHISYEATASYYMLINIQTGGSQTFRPEDLYLDY